MDPRILDQFFPEGLPKDFLEASLTEEELIAQGGIRLPDDLPKGLVDKEWNILDREGLLNFVGDRFPQQLEGLRKLYDKKIAYATQVIDSLCLEAYRSKIEEITVRRWALRNAAEDAAKIHCVAESVEVVKYKNAARLSSPLKIIDPNDPRMTVSLYKGGVLPPLPADWKGDNDGNPNFKSVGTLSTPVMRKIEPYGPHFLAYARRKRHGRTFSEDERIQAQSKVKKVEDDDAGEISEPEDPLMLQRDAKDWKGQDHYAVLGLSKYRYKATDEQIKKAHRKKVLRHHPDKKAAAGQEDENDSFFKCIQRANEILTDPIKRRQFDSVDEAADVPPPTKKDMQKSGNFYKKWSAVFESEARFSKKVPVPKLGDENSTKQDVEEFYDFWYNFDSWRTFEYLDEDVPDDNEGRDHKRHIEKKNANARRKRKTEDIARLRKLVDDCLGFDDRIKKFRKEGNANKNKKKLEKEAALKREAEEKQKAKEEEEAKKKAEDEAAKAQKEQDKKAKEAAKNAVKKNKRTVKASVKDVNYFVASGEPSAKQIDEVLDDAELVIGKIDPDELAALAAKLTLAGKDGEKVREVFVAEAGRLVEAGKAKDQEFKCFK